MCRPQKHYTGFINKLKPGKILTMISKSYLEQKTTFSINGTVKNAERRVRYISFTLQKISSKLTIVTMVDLEPLNHDHHHHLHHYYHHHHHQGFKIDWKQILLSYSTSQQHFSPSLLLHVHLLSLSDAHSSLLFRTQQVSKASHQEKRISKQAKETGIHTPIFTSPKRILCQQPFQIGRGPGAVWSCMAPCLLFQSL